jgi:hypothetical protein
MALAQILDAGDVFHLCSKPSCILTSCILPSCVHRFACSSSMLGAPAKIA